MKQKYFIGVDVSKEKLDVCLVDTHGQIIIEKVIKNEQSSITRFLAKTLGSIKSMKEDVLICCEHTGVYCRPLQLIASQIGYSLWVENPYKISKASTDLRGKSDRKDALRIAHYALRYSDRQILYTKESEQIRKLQVLLAARETLLGQVTSLRQEMNECKKFDPEKHLLLRSCYSHTIRSLVNELKKIKTKIDDLIASDHTLNTNAKLLQSIPGVGVQVSLNFLAITNGMSKFESAKQLACYAGVVPFPNQSGTVMRKDRVSRFANKKLKKLLHLAAMAATNTIGDLRAYYLRKVKQGKNKMAVLNAIRNKLVHRMFAVLQRQTPYVKLHR